jgi:hypothetical protein
VQRQEEQRSSQPRQREVPHVLCVAASLWVLDFVCSCWTSVWLSEKECKRVRKRETRAVRPQLAPLLVAALPFFSFPLPPALRLLLSVAPAQWLSSAHLSSAQLRAHLRATHPEEGHKQALRT